jgi:2-aminoadipate transaminase
VFGGKYFDVDLPQARIRPGPATPGRHCDHPALDYLPPMSVDRLVENLLSSGAKTSKSSVIRDLLRHASRPDVISLAGGIPAPELFPIERMVDAARGAFADLGAGAAQYGLTEGEEVMREVAAALAEDDGAPALPDSILVTTGSQQAIDLLGRVLIDRGDVVVVDDPAYLGALQALRKYDPELVGLPIDSEGMITDALADRLEDGLQVKAVYTNPNFQNPTGATLSARRRTHLAELADAHDFLIIEDDPYGALRFAGEALPSMAASSDRVVRVRTVSKILAPGLRVAWAIAPRRLIEALVIAKQATDLHTSTLNQHIAARLLGDRDWFAKHRASLAPWYGVRRDALAQGLAKRFGAGLSFTPPDGGMFLWAELGRELPEGATTADLLPIAIGLGVAFVPGGAFSVETPRPAHLRLAFATVSPGELAAAARLLGDAVDAWLG